MGPDLDRECALLCRGIFGVEPPSDCAAAYRRAHAVVCPPSASSGQAIWIAEAVRRGWDLEAMELVLRLRDPDNALTKKINILFYLMEARPEGFAIFVNQSPAPLRGWLSLVSETLRSVYKLSKGWILLRRLGAQHG